MEVENEEKENFEKKMSIDEDKKKSIVERIKKNKQVLAALFKTLKKKNKDLK